MIKEYDGMIGHFRFADMQWEVVINPNTGMDELHWIGGNDRCRLPKGVTSCAGMFRNCFLGKGFEMYDFHTENVFDMDEMFMNCHLPEGATTRLRGFDTSKVQSTVRMFKQCVIPEGFNLTAQATFSNVTDMSNMFEGCKFPSAFNLSSFDTSNVTNMTEMFKDCEALYSMDLSGTFNTSNVQDFTGMFRGCKIQESIKLGHNFTFKNAKSTVAMFQDSFMPADFRLPKDFSLSSVKHSLDMFRQCYIFNTERARYELLNDPEQLIKDSSSVHYDFKCIVKVPLETWDECESMDDVVRVVDTYCKVHERS